MYIYIINHENQLIMKKSAAIFSFLFVGFTTYVQAQPWLNPLLIATSTDGTTFGPAQIFQDSSGVPSVIRLNSGTLIAAFQWFPAPLSGPGWDSVAIKMSTNNGGSWSSPISANFTGIPGGYQRPFDPTLVETDSGQIRMFFSCRPAGFGLDSLVDTYSAISNDGINYIFENNARFDDLNDPVIDPACTKFNGTWHYTAPIGAPQDGAYHATSSDGLTFIQQADISSDMTHNWTGNLMVDSNEMKFYGCGSTIWWNATTDGTTWNGYTNTNIVAGGDPSVVKLLDGTYIMIYVGAPGWTAVEENGTTNITIYPNPSKDMIYINGIITENFFANIFDIQGKLILTNKNMQNNSVDISSLANGIYFLEIVDMQTKVRYKKKIIKD